MGHMGHHTHLVAQTTPAEFWEARYTKTADPVWSGRVNRVLADVAATLVPGRALDLGCGEGGDAVWLAQHGWRVTGVDLSPTAVARGRAAAASAGITEETLRLVAADLATWTPPEVYDLVTTSFLHSWPVEIPREDILRRAADLVAPAGRLLIVSHAAAPTWADPDMVRSHRFPTPAGDLESLRLDPARWDVLTVETRKRNTVGPDGQPAMLTDAVVLVRRHP